MTNVEMQVCIGKIMQCTDPKEVIDILDKCDLNLSEKLYCCIAASCVNKSNVEMLEKQLELAESNILK